MHKTFVKTHISAWGDTLFWCSTQIFYVCTKIWSTEKLAGWPQSLTLPTSSSQQLFNEHRMPPLPTCIQRQEGSCCASQLECFMQISISISETPIVASPKCQPSNHNNVTKRQHQQSGGTTRRVPMHGGKRGANFLPYRTGSQRRCNYQCSIWRQQAHGGSVRSPPAQWQ